MKKNPINPKDLDTAVRPQDDFFQYAAGGWLQRNPIPASEARWGAFDVLRHENDKKLHLLVKEVAKKTNPASKTPAQLVRDFWLSGMDIQRRNKLSFAPLYSYQKNIEDIRSRGDLLACVARLHRDGFDVIWGVGVGPDDHCADHNILHLMQGGLSLPDRDYYLKKDEHSRTILEGYKVYILEMLTQFGIEREEAMQMRDTILKIETSLARASMTRVELRNPYLQDNPYTIAALQREYLKLDWKQYLGLIGARTSRLNVAQPKFLSTASKMVTSVSLDDWKTYLLWHIINGSAGALSQKISALSFSFYGKQLQGMEEQRPLWKRTVYVIDSAVGDALGQLYVAKYFPPRAKKSIDALVENIFKACAQRITQLDWMTPKTKQKALEKLAVIHSKVGYPNKWIDYRGLTIRADDYFGNLIRANQYEHKRQMRKIDKKVDSSEWEMTPSTVNAYFHPNHNEIVFPAGILQAPFFDVDAPDAMNYGAIGSVIGHEITHAFDDEGRKFDAKGNLKDWWKPEDARAFDRRAAILRRQYDSFEVLPNFFVNGKLTLGENIADLGGLLIAYDAWQMTRSGKSATPKRRSFSDEQLFFFGLTACERGANRTEDLKRRLVVDPHSPSKCRVNGPFRNIDAFYDVFDVGPKDKMYLAPSKRARIW